MTLPKTRPTVIGADSPLPAWVGPVALGSIALLFAGAWYAEANTPKPAPTRPPRYPRLNLP